jgi:hypothetical protein
MRRGGLLAQRLGVNVGLVGTRTMVDTSNWPNRAPYSITSHVYRALSEKAETLLYDWRERVTIGKVENEILLGHPLPNENSAVWNRACQNGGFGIRVAMTPLSHKMPEVCYHLEQYIPYIDAIFGIMGSYWYDTWERSPLAHWKEKIIPVDMAIDISQYPRVKKSFNRMGNRKFLYIGWSGPQKGTHLLSILFGLAREHKCIWVGSGKALPNLDHRPAAMFDMDYLARLADECDFVISMGVSDANPTTVLESMAWGFPVCCTPESGYYNMPEIIEMSTTSMEHNRRILGWLQNAPEEELLARADRARRLVEEKYTWERFVGTIMGGLERIGRKKNVKVWEGGK